MHIPLLKGKIHTPALQATIDKPLRHDVTDESQQTGQNEPVSDPGLCDFSHTQNSSNGKGLW